MARAVLEEDPVAQPSTLELPDIQGIVLFAYASLQKPIERQQHATSLVAGIARVMLFFVAVHAATVGYGVWIAPSTWPGSMPPLTAWSFLLAAAFCVLPRRSASR